MLPDSGYIQEEDIKYVNKINKRKGLPQRLPLYTRKEAERALKYFRSLDYQRSFSLSKDIDLTFYDAGHILGSAISVLDLKVSRRPLRIAYAVDLGRRHMPLLEDPQIPQDIDYLIMESTYGNRQHSDIKDAELVLAQTINKTIKRGGKIIIPSFALERTQLIVFFISELMKRKMVRKIPIYVDGPLAVNLTQVFRNNWKYFDETTRKSFSKNKDPLGYDNITYIENVNKSKQLHDLDRPAIIISASGMCENGRILHHLKNNIENPKNTIVVIGFMAKNTLGKRIVERNETVRIFGQLYELKSEVVVINAFSSHADSDGLLDFARSCGKRLKGIFLVHGDLEQSEPLRDRLQKKLNIKVKIPRRGEEFSLRSPRRSRTT